MSLHSLVITLRTRRMQQQTAVAIRLVMTASEKRRLKRKPHPSRCPLSYFLKLKAWIIPL